MLQGKVAVITGGAKGIGFAIAENFVSHGAKVVLADINAEHAQESAEKLGGSGTACGLACDVTDPDAVRAAVEAATDEFGSLDVMVNNAGITRDATMRKMTLADFEAVLDVHVKGAWLGTRAAAAVMREQGHGSIVNISSISGKVGMIGQTNYSAAKAGIVGLTKAAAKEVAHKGVRVNAVQPGLIHTDMTAALREDVLKAKLAEIPMQRAGEPAEVANVVLFLASDMSSYMTGCVLEITGGRHI
ncbi:3-oxoacyl-ACP reductase FabG [Saccharopolyspora phatthalungensis]|uniref:3-oxoacyl-[acyl-carrier protein] reductase n=1 Tax=Saccharopolyspora phatthalungensis TaxID=664693 RepID=A0A840QAA1_9PSEU|nr:3-oxoacyl-ACP reductase FabG [Saccharopolyspora phatthalungensis]MBB5156760.1 3-oxoacyl-[acyl-carrier protein] reductase [Saccharopolyspora phatthalungensis]